MVKSRDQQTFPARLAGARAAEESLKIKSPKAALNGQISSGDEDMSSWDNYDRYFKFGSISKT
jgi:hypothetical protein